MVSPIRAGAAAPIADRERPGLGANLLLRRIHTWIGMLIAPSVLFFATTGSLQLYSLHEAHGGYTPPSLLVALGSLHKDQKLPGPPRPGAAGAKAEAEHHHDDDAGPPKPATPLLKIVFLSVAVGLIVSTLLGLWMALQDRLRRRTNLALLAVGLVLPLALVLSLG
jgi:hypothetical protein